jgi:kinesin family protein 2/24
VCSDLSTTINNHYILFNSNQQQLLSCLHSGQTIDIQRSNGRIHHAVITKVNHAAKTATVEWQEKNEGKGKEVDLDAIVQFNPNLFTSVTNFSPYHGAVDANNNHDLYLNETTVTHSNRRARQDKEKFRRQSHPAPTARPGAISHNDISPQRQPVDGNKSKVVKKIERIAANREQRRVKQEERRQKLIDVDHSIPAWEFQAMVNEY